MDKKLLGRRINAARRERGWTSERLSEICNINATYLRQIESGAKTPSLQVFVELCEALKVSPTYLLADSLPGAESQDLDALLTLCHDNRHDPQRDRSHTGLSASNQRTEKPSG